MIFENKMSHLNSSCPGIRDKNKLSKEKIICKSVTANLSKTMLCGTLKEGTRGYQQGYLK